MATDSDEMTAPGCGVPVVLTVTHGGVNIPADVAALAVPVLSAVVTTFGSGGRRGHTRHRGEEGYYAVSPDGDLRVAAGLVDRVAEHLRALGIEVSVDDRRRFTGPQQPDPGVIGRSRADLVPLLVAAAERPRGLGLVAGRDELADRVAGLCELFPKAAVAIVEANAARADDLYRRLVRRLGGGVFLGNEDFWHARARRVVMTARKGGLLHPDGWGVLIAADALAATARGNWPALGRLCGLRAYGFLPADRPLSDRERLSVEAVFGRPLVLAPAGPGVAVHMSISPRAVAPVSTDPLARKRAAIWGAAKRNGHIAAVAAAARACDTGELVELGLGCLADELTARRDRMLRVAVLVESPEHGRHLIARLPGWRLVRQEIRPHRPGWGGWDAAAPLRDPDGFDGCVITTLAARQIGSLGVDVLVRADGAASPMRLPGFPAPDRGPDRAQVLIDFADDFDNTAVEDTRSRLRAYGEAGWQVYAAPRLAPAD